MSGSPMTLSPSRTSQAHFVITSLVTAQDMATPTTPEMSSSPNSILNILANATNTPLTPRSRCSGEILSCARIVNSDFHFLFKFRPPKFESSPTRWFGFGFLFFSLDVVRASLRHVDDLLQCLWYGVLDNRDIGLYIRALL